jgi:hypothetical protein
VGVTDSGVNRRAICAAVTGCAGVVDSFFLDSEKMLVEWPDVDGVLVEEMR